MGCDANSHHSLWKCNQRHRKSFQKINIKYCVFFKYNIYSKHKYIEIIVESNLTNAFHFPKPLVILFCGSLIDDSNVMKNQTDKLLFLILYLNRISIYLVGIYTSKEILLSEPLKRMNNSACNETYKRDI